MLSLDALERLSRYEAGDLPESERRQFDSELRTDPDLARGLAHCQLIDQMLNEIGAEPISRQDERLIHRVVHRRPPGRRWWAVAAAAIVVVAGTALALHNGRRGGEPRGAVATGTAETQAPQGETTHVKAGESSSSRTSNGAAVANTQRTRSTLDSSEALDNRRETFAAALHKFLPALTHCYKKGLAQNPELEGSIIARLTLVTGPDDQGKVADATVDKDYSLANPFVVSCVLQQLMGATVPFPTDGTDVVVLPLYFHRGDGAEEDRVVIAIPQDLSSAAAAPPAQAAQAIVTGNAHARGASDAKVTVVEFSDPECPFCGRAHGSIDLLYLELGDRVRFAMKFAPLPMHRRAPTAVAAAFAAGEQGKFWEYVDALFSHPDALDRGGLERMAVQLGLKMKDFNEALDSNRFGPAMEADQNQAKTLGVTGLPTLFINGRPLIGARPIDEIRAKILEALNQGG